MFTGIIEEVGKVKDLRRSGKEASITVVSERVQHGLKTGESVSVNGVCLTAVEVERDGFMADISEESLSRSTLGGLRRGTPVNLERALSLGGRLGGHIVQGHVDGMGRVEAVRDIGDGRVYTFSAPTEVWEYLVEKGSIAVDGISLTISELSEDGFSVAAIPLTVEETNLKGIAVGEAVNLEVDILAKYVRRYLERGFPGREDGGESGGSFYDKLVEGGFL
jgi:riboflavin synthase